MGPLGVDVWKYIRGWKKFSKFVRFEVSYGSHISFSHDVWCGNNHWRYVIRICLVSYVVRKCGWRIISSSKIEGLNGL